MKRTTTEILIETRETIVVRRAPQALREPLKLRGWCEGCQRETIFLITEHAAAALGVSTREIFRRVERGAFHFHETAEGATLVCVASLSSNNSSI